MPKVPVIGGFNVLQDKQSANERSINIMPETYNGMTTRRLRPTPGLRSFTTLLGAPVRGYLYTKGRCFIAADISLYELYADGTFDVIGAIDNNGNPVQMASNGLQIILVDGENGWGMNLDDNNVTLISNPNFYPTRTITVSGGYAIGVREGTDQFFHSDLYDVFTWIFSDFASAEISPDNLQAVIKDSVGLAVLGESSLEIFTQTTDPVQVFQRRAGYTASFGCAAPYTALNVNNSVVWLGRDEDGVGGVYRLQGGIPSVISDVAISEAINIAGDAINSATAFSYQLSGRSFYLLNIPGKNTTFVYDFSEKQWHERRSFSDDYSVWGRYKADGHVYAFGRNLVGSYNSGQIFELDFDYFKDGDTLVRRERTMTPLYDEEGDNYGEFSVFGLECTVGEGTTNPPYDDPVIALETSNDNGITFSSIMEKSLGKRGKRLTQLRWKRLGFSRSRVHRISMMAPIPFDIKRAWVE